MKGIRALSSAVSLAALLALSACAPVTSTLPPEEPLFFSARYDALFDATLQEMTSTYVRTGGARATFAVTQADRDTGLITAVRTEPRPRSSLSLRGRRYYDHDDDYDHDEEGVFFGPFFRVYVPVPAPEPERTIVSAVLRPADGGATLVYSSSGPNSTSSTANRFMAQVAENLRGRFPQPEPAAPQNP